MTLSRHRNFRELTGLALLLAVQLSVGLLRINSPFSEASSYGRSCINATFARNFYLDGFHFFAPRLDFGPAPGYAVQEFPFLNYLVGLSYLVFGVQDWPGRLFPLLFGLGTTVAVFFWVKRLFHLNQSATFAAFIVVISPTFAYFDRVFQSDSAMLFFTVLSFFLIEKLRQKLTAPLLLIFTGSLSLALLLKPSTSVLIPSAAVYLFYVLPKDRRRILYAGLCLGSALLATAAFYVWAHYFNSYDYMGLAVVMKRSKLSYIFSAKPYFQILKDILKAVTPLGVAALLAGPVLVLKTRKHFFIPMWIAGCIALDVVFNEGLSHHLYYQLIWLPISAVCGGWALSVAMPAFAAWSPGRRVLCVGSTIFLLALSTATYFAFMRTMFQHDPWLESQVDLGKLIRTYVPQNELVLFTTDITALYYSGHRGHIFVDSASSLRDQMKSPKFPNYKYFTVARNSQFQSDVGPLLRKNGTLLGTTDEFEIWYGPDLLAQLR